MGGGKRLVQEARRWHTSMLLAVLSQDMCGTPLRPHEKDLGLYFGFALLFDMPFRIHVVFSCCCRILGPRPKQVDAHGIRQESDKLVLNLSISALCYMSMRTNTLSGSMAALEESSTTSFLFACVLGKNTHIVHCLALLRTNTSPEAAVAAKANTFSTAVCTFVAR